MASGEQNIVFTLTEVNQILNALGEIPAKHSLDLVNFIRAKAQEQVNAANAAPEVPAAPEEKKD